MGIHGDQQICRSAPQPHWSLVLFLAPLGTVLKLCSLRGWVFNAQLAVTCFNPRAPWVMGLVLFQDL